MLNDNCYYCGVLIDTFSSHPVYLLRKDSVVAQAHHASCVLERLEAHDRLVTWIDQLEDGLLEEIYDQEIICQVKACENEADFDRPADLCLKHHAIWFSCDIEDADDALSRILNGEEIEMPKGTFYV